MGRGAQDRGLWSALACLLVLALLPLPPAGAGRAPSGPLIAATDPPTQRAGPSQAPRTPLVGAAHRESATTPTPAALPTAPPLTAADRARIGAAFRSAPLLCIENVGQFDPRARFQVRGAGGTLWLADDAL